MGVKRQQEVRKCGESVAGGPAASHSYPAAQAGSDTARLETIEREGEPGTTVGIEAFGVAGNRRVVGSLPFGAPAQGTQGVSPGQAGLAPAGIDPHRVAHLILGAFRFAQGDPGLCQRPPAVGVVWMQAGGRCKRNRGIMGFAASEVRPPQGKPRLRAFLTNANREEGVRHAGIGIPLPDRQKGQRLRCRGVGGVKLQRRAILMQGALTGALSIVGIPSHQAVEGHAFIQMAYSSAASWTR